MTPDEARRRAEIMLAWSNGEVIQHKSPATSNRWTDSLPLDSTSKMLFIFETIEYRLKPKLIELWAVVFDKPKTVKVYDNEADAVHMCGELNRFRSVGSDSWRIVKMQEVISE